jgi:hypothetical protein
MKVILLLVLIVAVWEAIDIATNDIAGIDV